MTAVIFFAEDLFNASIHKSNSIKLSFAGEEIDWIIKILFPLIFSFISIYISPSENFLILELISLLFKNFAIFLLKGLLLFPDNNFI